MKRLLFIFVLMLLAIAVFAFSPEFHNKDSRSYRYKITCGGSSSTTSINSNNSTTLSGQAGCKLEVFGVGSATLKNDKKYIIKNGKLIIK